MNVKSILKVSIRQIKAARALLDWSQQQLAAAADVSIPTIKRLEAQDGLLGGRSETGAKIQRALQRAGIEFIDENGGGPGVRLRKELRGGQSVLSDLSAKRKKPKPSHGAVGVHRKKRRC